MTRLKHSFNSKKVHRVVIKVGTSSLTDKAGRIQPPKMWAIARAVQVLEHTLTCKVVLVSSGAGAVGRERLGLSLPLTMPDKQAAAAVGQALLMLDWAQAFAPLPVAQLLLTHADIQERRRYVNAKNTLEASLRLGSIPIINENDSITSREIKFGDNDTLSAWAAYLAGADLLIILTDVDGLYDADPRTNPDAKRIEEVHDISTVMPLAGDAGSSRGTGGMFTKLRAAQIASEAGIDTIIISGGGQGLEQLTRAKLNVHGIGTRIIATNPKPARKAWIAQQHARGTIEIDTGALHALQGGRSLLPIGITASTGTFEFGDAVAITYKGKQVAQGLTNYSSGSLQSIQGLKTSEIMAVLGYKDYDTVIHRDNLVILDQAAQSTA